MDKRIIIISSCDECRFRIMTDACGMYVCGHPEYIKTLTKKYYTDRPYLQHGEIPEWCPLEKR